jgi:hypothetical protein
MIRWWRARRRRPEPVPEPQRELPVPVVSRGAIKGNEATGLFHTPESPHYGRVRGDVWFETEDEARAAGFRRWDDRWS